MLFDILEDHLDEAVHLFCRRQLAIDMLDMTGEDLAELDERLRAHLEGMLLGGEDAWGLCKDLLAEGASDEAFVAGIVALEGGDASRLQVLEEVLAGENREAAEGVGWACSLTRWPGVSDFLMNQCEREVVPARAIALQAMINRRIDPGHHLDAALKDPATPAFLWGIRGAGVFQKRHLLPAVEQHTSTENPEVRAAALESLVMLEPEKGRLACLEALSSDGPVPAAAGLLGVVGQRQDLDAIVRAAASENRSLAREAILALGNLGYVSAVPFLIGLLKSPVDAGVASVALQRIFGDLMPEKSAEAKKDEADSDLMDEWHPDDDLAVYAESELSPWWEERRNRFDHEKRHRGGVLFKPEGIGPATPIGLQHYEGMERLVP